MLIYSMTIVSRNWLAYTNTKEKQKLKLTNNIKDKLITNKNKAYIKNLQIHEN